MKTIGMNGAKQKPDEGAQRILFALGRLTVLRGFLRTQPVVQLSALCDALAAGNAIEATYRYHSMTAALLEENSRRVTGDIWKDFVFAELLERPNRFSVLAAEGKIDPPVQKAMEHDLGLMQELFSLRGETLTQWVGVLAGQGEGVNTNAQSKEKKQNVPTREQPDERISRMALSAWGGSEYITERKAPKASVEPRPTEATLPRDLELSSWVRWEYETPGEALEYVADEALALVYRRFLGEESWALLAEALGEFHRKYGCGEFLRYRVFIATDEGLQGIDSDFAPDWDALIGLARQKEKLYANTLRFVHTGQGENILLHGADGMGKTSLVMSLSRELPDLRLILMAQRNYASSLETIRSLAGQPFRFIALMDDVSLSPRDYRRLKAAFAYNRGAGNALLYATSHDPAPDGSLFGLQISFAAPSFDEFVQMVHDLVRNERVYVEESELHETCMAWQRESEDYSARAASMVCKRLIRANFQK